MVRFGPYSNAKFMPAEEFHGSSRITPALHRPLP